MIAYPLSVTVYPLSVTVYPLTVTVYHGAAAAALIISRHYIWRIRIGFAFLLPHSDLVVFKVVMGRWEKNQLKMRAIEQFISPVTPATGRRVIQTRLIYFFVWEITNEIH